MANKKKIQSSESTELSLKKKPVEEQPVEEEEIVEEQPQEAPVEEAEAPVEEGADDAVPRVTISLPVDGSMQVQANGKGVCVDPEGNTEVAITENTSRKINIRHQAIFEGRSLTLTEKRDVVKITDKSKVTTTVKGSYNNSNFNNSNNTAGVNNKIYGSVSGNAFATNNQGSIKSTGSIVHGNDNNKKPAAKKPGTRGATTGHPKYRPGTKRKGANGTTYEYDGDYVIITTPDGKKKKRLIRGRTLTEFVEVVLRTLKQPVTESALVKISESLDPEKSIKGVSQFFPLPLLESYTKEDLPLRESSLGSFKAKSSNVERVCFELLEFYKGYEYDRDTFKKQIMESCIGDSDSIGDITDISDDADYMLDLLESEIANYSNALTAVNEYIAEAKKLEVEKPVAKPVLKENKNASFILESFIVDDCKEDKSVYEALTEDVKMDSLKEIAKEILLAVSNKLEEVDATSADKSRGDIKLLKELPSIQDAITKLEALIERDENALPQYGQYINTIIKSILFINQYSVVFKEAYRNKKTVMILKYESLILAIISAVSYFLSTVVSYKGNNISLKDSCPEGFLEFAPLVALDSFNKSVESGEFKIIANDVTVLREYFLEVPVETMGSILEASDYLPMIVNGVKNLAGSFDTTKLTNLLYKAASVVILIFSLREVFYTLFRMKTKVSEMLANIGLFSNANNGGNVLNKLSAFASKFRTDAAAGSDLGKREVEDENRKILGQIKVAQSSVLAAPKTDKVMPVADRATAITEPEDMSGSFFGIDF